MAEANHTFFVKEGFESIFEILDENTPEYAYVILKLVSYIKNLLNCKILRAIKVNNYERQDAFEKIEGEEIHVWHGTSSLNLPNLIGNGFDIARSKKGHFGRGIYFAERPLKAHTYTKKINDKRVLLLCRIKPGKIKEYPKGVNDPDLINKGDADSVTGSIFNGPEIVIYDNDRVIIDYVIYYNII